MDERYLIVARNKAEAEVYARSHKLSNWRYANPPYLDGIQDLTVIWLPGCEDNPHIREIKDKLNLAMYMGLRHFHEVG